MRRLREVTPVRIDRDEIRVGLDQLRTAPESRPWMKALAGDAIDYIRQLEGDLRRAGFTEYNDPKEKDIDQ